MKRKILLGFLIAAALPLTTYALTADEIRAEIESLLSQLAQLQQLLASAAPQSGGAISSSESSTVCAISRYPLKRGDRGGDVANLQAFLKSQGLFTGNITAYFGPLTARALLEFQIRNGVIAAAADGGAFGPLTFNYVLGRFCTARPTTPITPISPIVPTSPIVQCNPPPSLPPVDCVGSWQKTYSGNQCHVGWTCVATVATSTSSAAINKPPLISAIVGPTLLKPDESGSWRVDATDPESGALLYSIVWGDEGSALPQILNIAREGTTYSSATTTFSHAYKKTGAYTMVAFVKDPAGNDTSASLAVQVRTPEPPPSAPLAPSHASGDSCVLNGVTTAHTAVIPNPTCSGTCSYPYLQCVSGQWVALPTGSGSTDTTSYACYMNGQGESAKDIPESCKQGAGRWYTDAVPLSIALKLCEPYLNGSMLCTSDGWMGGQWGGGYIYPPHNVTVACTTSNGLYIPGNMSVLGSKCFKDDKTQTNCDSHYICKRDGWWLLDGTGIELQKVEPPWVAKETFYPNY